MTSVPTAVFWDVVPCSLLELDRRFRASRRLIALIMSHVVKFRVLEAISVNMAVFWNIVPCSLLELDRRFRVSRRLC
jgi:uncharacterized membrane protein